MFKILIAGPGTSEGTARMGERDGLTNFRKWRSDCDSAAKINAMLTRIVVR